MWARLMVRAVRAHDLRRYRDLEQEPHSVPRVTVCGPEKGRVSCSLHRNSTTPDIGTGERKKPASWRSKRAANGTRRECSRSRTITTSLPLEGQYALSARRRGADDAVCWAWRIHRCDLAAGRYIPSRRGRRAVWAFLTHAAAIRLATLATVARLQPVESCIEVQECFRCGLETKDTPTVSLSIQ